MCLVDLPALSTFLVSNNKLSVVQLAAALEEQLVRMIAAALILCSVVESQAGDLAKGPHSLIATFHEKDARWNFFHDVKVRSKSGQVTLVVLHDLAKEGDRGSGNEEPDLKPNTGGFGDPSKDGAVKWPRRPAGQEPWLLPKRKLHGSINAEGIVQFGVTVARGGRLVSLHFVGRPSVTGASGKVYLLSSEKPVLEGTWKLNNPVAYGRLIPGFNGAQSPFGR